MNRRNLFAFLSSLGLARLAAAATAAPATASAADVKAIVPLRLTDAEWQKRLSGPQYDVLRHEGTERAGTSPLNAEKRKGLYH
ncbi:MAG: peptide-methionine (R)-S-oxide reductase, partial [Candidatus Saccharibacteria bacterium]|nr:peptide-methionine (R)-S-oxide reductase [Rhodoferax sp.]